MNVINRNELQESFAEKDYHYLKKNKVGIAHLSQRFGKIRYTTLLINKLFNYPATILICYPDNKIKDSFLNDFKKWEFNNHNITYVNFSSLKKYNNFKFDIIIVDEAQSLSENERNLFSLINYDYMLILSGTLNKETQNKLKESLNINIMSEYLIEEAIKDNIVSDYEITIHLVELNDTLKNRESKGIKITEKKLYDNYTYVIEKLKRENKDFMFLSLHRNRVSQSSLSKKNKTIQLIKNNKDKRILIFTGLAKIAENLGVPYYHTKCKTTESFDDFLAEKENKLALIGVGKAGVTYNNLDGIVISNFVGNSEELGQIISRAVLLDFKSKCAKIDIICLNEKPEIKKLNKALELLDKTKIIWKK